MHLQLSDLLSRIRKCDNIKCELHPARGYASQVVVGKGNPNPRIMFIGEAPGEGEDLSGYPFVTTRDAGGILTDALIAIGIDRDTDIWIDNIVKCRPPGNRNPTYNEINTCINWLNSELSILKPECIVLLGNVPRSKFLPATSGVTRSHGQFHEKWIDISNDGSDYVDMTNFNFLITYHPSYVKRSGGLDSQVGMEFIEDLEQLIFLYFTEKGWRR